MKFIKRLISWTIIPVIISFSILFYVENFYLGTEKNLNINKVEEKDNNIKKDVKLDIPASADNIGVSYNGEYFSYIEDGQLSIVETNSKKNKTIDINDGEINYSVWLPDRNIFIIAEKVQGQNSPYLRFYSYDSERGEKTQLADNNNKKTIINLQSSGYNIKDIALSTSTNTMYVRIENGYNRSIVYRINTMAELEKKYDVGSDIEKIGIMNSEDRLIYEDNINHKIHIESKQDQGISIEEGRNYSLLGVDEGDIVYTGRVSLDNEKNIDRITYWNAGESNTTRKELDLQIPVPKDSIYVLNNGKVFANYKDKKVLRNVINGKEYAYKGKLTSVYSGGIAYIYNGKLEIKSF
ncbi:hypothetical protein [Clostridium oceanicum]|uniref:Dipeptidyl peptidase IV n=1 Tax=Clostridium oceanicum TaxID=1543 RepID=A0ABN1JDS2_9CLOT